jgi:hypothetical protein
MMMGRRAGEAPGIVGGIRRQGRHALPDVITALLAGLAVLGCGQETAGSVDALYVESRSPFRDRFVVARRIVLQQNETHLVASIAQVLRLPNGDFLVVDDREADVKVFGPDGSLRRVLGSEGEGPGEFLQPRRAAVDRHGRIHVLDWSLKRVEVFRPGGAFLKNVALERLETPKAVGVLSDGSYVFLDAGPSKEDVLVHTDSLGSIEASYLPISHIVPVGERAGYEWDYPRQFFLDVEGETAFVICSLRNTLWTIDLSSGSVTQTTVDFPGYLRPVLWSASDRVETGKDAIEWFLSKHLTGFIRVDRGQVYWPFIRGEIMRGDPTLLLHRDLAGHWEVLDSAPIVVDAFGGQVIAVEAPGTDDMRLVVYDPR